MRVVLLGTGAADGWPNPFCTCASCESARAIGTVRTTTAAVVDDALLLDCGPDAPRQAERAGLRLASLRAVLVTHAHPDHLAPEALLARSWAGRTEPLRVIGPASVVEACGPWIGPRDQVVLEQVAPGALVHVDGYAVRVLAAAHDVGTDALAADAVLFDVTAPDGSRLLYATDTGPLAEPAVEELRGSALDLLLLEETFGHRTDHGTGHHDLESFPHELARLRSVGAVTSTTDVVAVHLGHHNPPDLADVLALWGARVVDDLAVLGDGASPARPQPPRRVLVVGGARSGKSRTAELMLADIDGVRYVATGGRRDDDAEWLQRVSVHRARRPSTWGTVETLDVEGALLAEVGSPILVDCLALWLAGQLDDAGTWAAAPGTPEREKAVAVVEARIDALCDALRRTSARAVLVSNEVGSGVVPEHESGRLYRDLLGTLNARIGAECDEVRLVVAGRSLAL